MPGYSTINQRVSIGGHVWHLRVLSDAGLVRSRRHGRERIYSLSPRPLRQAFDWLAHFESFWTDRLDALGDHLDDEP